MHGRLSVCPVNICLGLFQNKVRQKDKAASTLFYIPNDVAEAAHHEGKTTAIHKLQNLQNTLRLGFSDMKYFMDNKLTVEWELE